MSFNITGEEFAEYAELVGVKIPDMQVRKARGDFTFRTVHRIQKVAPERQNVFGWASVGYLPTGNPSVYSEYTDWQGDVLKHVEDIENAAYDFTLHSRDQGLDHIGKGGIGSLIESFVSTPEKWEAMGIPSGVLPVAWWTGFHISDPEAWAGVRKGKYRMFSVQGTGRRIPL